MRALARFWTENRKVIVLTFEVFWIVVFLIEAATSGAGQQVAQFVYVNF